MLLLHFSDDAQAAERLAAAAGMTCLPVRVHRFPDGEHKLTLPLPVGRHTIFYRSLNYPNAKLIDLLLAARCAREHGAEQLTLIAPYLCYMRQDTAFSPGEAVSQRIVGGLLAELFDAVITVDAHLHRTSSLAQAVPARRALNLSAAELMGAYLRQHAAADALLLGPDAESTPWVAAIAAQSGHDYGIATKQRLADDRVCIQLPRFEVQRREVWLVDDVLATGQTLAECAKRLAAIGAAAVHCMVTHALCVAGAEDVLRAAGVRRLVSSDSVLHASNRIHLAQLLAAAIKGD